MATPRAAQNGTFQRMSRRGMEDVIGGSHDSTDAWEPPNQPEMSQLDPPQLLVGNRFWSSPREVEPASALKWLRLRSFSGSLTTFHTPGPSCFSQPRGAGRDAIPCAAERHAGPMIVLARPRSRRLRRIT
jgi:hypothetical protein